MTYTPQYETVDIEAPAEIAPYAPGGSPLRATVRMPTTRSEQLRFKTPVKTLAEGYALYAPFFIAWSVDGIDPPAVAGPDAFLELSQTTAVWLLAESARQIAPWMRREAKKYSQQSQTMLDLQTIPDVGPPAA